MHEHVRQRVRVHAADAIADAAGPDAVQGPGVDITQAVPEDGAVRSDQTKDIMTNNPGLGYILLGYFFIMMII